MHPILCPRRGPSGHPPSGPPHNGVLGLLRGALRGTLRDLVLLPHWLWNVPIASQTAVGPPSSLQELHKDSPSLVISCRKNKSQGFLGGGGGHCDFFHPLIPISLLFVLPALLQKLVGDFFWFSQGNLENLVAKFGGNFPGFFWPTEQSLENFGEIFGAFFVRKFVARKNSFVQNSLWLFGFPYFFPFANLPCLSGRNSLKSLETKSQKRPQKARQIAQGKAWTSKKARKGGSRPATENHNRNRGKLATLSALSS